MQNRTRKITLGALLAAIVGVVLLVNRQFGGAFDIYLIWVIPIPLILYAAEYGVKDALVVAVSTVILAFVVSSPVTVIYTLFSVLLGIVYGYGLNKGKSAYWLLIAAILGSFAMEIVTTYLFADFFGYGIDLQIAELKEMMAKMHVEFPAGWNLLHIILIMVVLTAVMEGVMIHLLTGLIAKRMKLKYPQYTPGKDLRMPKWLAVLSVLVIGAWIAVGFANPETKTAEYLLIASLPLFLIGLFYGYITVVIWLKMHVNPRMIWLFVVLLLLGAPVTFPFMAGIGYADAFLNFKDRMRNGRVR